MILSDWVCYRNKIVNLSLLELALEDESIILKVLGESLLTSSP